MLRLLHPLTLLSIMAASLACEVGSEKTLSSSKVLTGIEKEHIQTLRSGEPAMWSERSTKARNSDELGRDPLGFDSELMSQTLAELVGKVRSALHAARDSGVEVLPLPVGSPANYGHEIDYSPLEEAVAEGDNAFPAMPIPLASIVEAGEENTWTWKVPADLDCMQNFLDVVESEPLLPQHEQYWELFLKGLNALSGCRQGQTSVENAAKLFKPRLFFWAPSMFLVPFLVDKAHNESEPPHEALSSEFLIRARTFLTYPIPLAAQITRVSTSSGDKYFTPFDLAMFHALKSSRKADRDAYWAAQTVSAAGLIDPVAVLGFSVGQLSVPPYFYRAPHPKNGQAVECAPSSRPAWAQCWYPTGTTTADRTLHVEAFLRNGFADGAHQRTLFGNRHDVMETLVNGLSASEKSSLYDLVFLKNVGLHIPSASHQEGGACSRRHGFELEEQFKKYQVAFPLLEGGNGQPKHKQYAVMIVEGDQEGAPVLYWPDGERVQL